MAVNEIVHGIELIPDEVKAIRSGKDYLNFPAWFTSKVNLLVTRRAARQATPQSIAERYDAAHARALELLDTVQDDEWHQGAHFFGEGVLDDGVRLPGQHHRAF